MLSNSGDVLQFHLFKQAPGLLQIFFCGDAIELPGGGLGGEEAFTNFEPGAGKVGLGTYALPFGLIYQTI